MSSTFNTRVRNQSHQFQNSNFKPSTKVSTLYNLLPNRNSQKSQGSKILSKIATSTTDFEGGGYGEIKYEEQDFSNIISTTILQ